MAISSVKADIPESKVGRNFLHGNSTSHTWIFSAIAELIDNAYDPDVAATQIKLDCGNIGGKDTLEFIDNGFGMDPDKLHKMLSLGFSDKPTIKGHIPIGQYGNGFKSGSMRLAKDAMVFTVHSSTVSAGFLSQTYLQTIEAETVIVPIVTWSLPQSDEMVDRPQEKNSLHAILTYSAFNSEQLLLQQFKDIVTNGARGTKIILYNLKQNRYGSYELDFHSDAKDILNPETQTLDRSTMERPLIDTSPTYRKSLREYLSILFLKPRMKIILRNVKVKTKLVSKSLSKTEKDFYRPHWIEKPIQMIFGFNQDKDSVDYGMLLYNRNRLIKAYEKVGYQKQPNELGVGVVGVVEVGFLQPIHNKTDFDKDDRYNAFINALSTKLNEYWNEKMNNTEVLPAEQTKKTDWLWAQCDRCLKWRRMMDRTDNDLPDKWYCYMNSDATHNQCSIPEEPEDEDDVLSASYVKTFKKKQEEKKRQSRQEEIRASEDREKRIIQREEIVQKNMQVIKQASTSKASQRESLEKARVALEAAKRHSAHQNNIIKELSKQKSHIEKNQRDLLKITERVAINQSELQSDGVHVCNAAEELADDVPDNNTVRSRASSSRKRHIIETEDGPIIIETASGSDSTAASDPKKKTRHKSASSTADAKEKDEAMIDLTSSDIEDDKDDVTEDTNAGGDGDVKPNVDALNEAISAETESTDTTDTVNTPASTCTVPTTSYSVKAKKVTRRGVQCSVEMISQYTQTGTVLPDGTTVSVKSEEDEIKIAELKKQLREKTSELDELRTNVRSLLEQIVPDANMKSIPSIDQVVTEMLRISDNDSSQ